MADWRKLIEDNREKIADELENALKLAIENRNECRVYIYADGKVETFEDPSHGNSRPVGDCRFIHSFDYQTWTASDYYGDNEVYLEDLENAMTDEQRDAYSKAEGTDEFGRIDWIRQNAPKAYEEIWNYAVTGEIEDTDFDEIINDALAEL